MTKLARLVWRVSLPIILAAISETLLHLINTIFLARVGVTELGALAIADSVMLLVLDLHGFDQSQWQNQHQKHD